MSLLSNANASAGSIPEVVPDDSIVNTATVEK